MPGIDGRSLGPLLARTPADWRTSFLIEYTTDIVLPRTLNSKEAKMIGVGAASWAKTPCGPSATNSSATATSRT
jgi:hypothetical protein